MSLLCRMSSKLFTFSYFFNQSCEGDGKNGDVVVEHDDLPSLSSFKSKSSGDDDDDDDDNDDNWLVEKLHLGALQDWFRDHSDDLGTAMGVLCILAYSAYFTYALYYEFGNEPSIRLLWVTMLVVLVFFILIVRDHFGDSINEHFFDPLERFVVLHWTIFKWFAALLVLFQISKFCCT